MNTNYFFNECQSALSDSAIPAGSITPNPTGMMESFGQSGIDTLNTNALQTKDLSDDLNNLDDFDDDFSECSIEENDTNETLKEDFDEDFADDFKDGTDASTSEKHLQEENITTNTDSGVHENTVTSLSAMSKTDTILETKGSLGISSVNFDLPRTNNSEWNIMIELEHFLDDHLPESSNESIIGKWNKLYNDNLISNDQVIQKYLAVHYGLWFQNSTALETALVYGKEFLNNLNFDYRVCTLSDIQFIKDVYKEDWYNSDILNKYALDTSYDLQLIQLMRTGSAQIELLDKYRNIPNALSCYLRLVNAEKFTLGLFEDALQRNNILGYTNAALNSEIDRFEVIKHRDDLNQIKEVVFNIENNGGIVPNEILEKYRNAKYLIAIILGNASGLYNEIFIENYLVNDLGNFEFISELYSNGAIDVDVAPDNFMFSMIMTDLQKFGLNAKGIEPYKSEMALSCLICSRYAGNLSEIDYKRFLAVLS